MHDNNDNDSSNGARGDGGTQPRHSLASIDGQPGAKKWGTWADVPLVLTIVELAVTLRVSRATAYAAVSDGSIPCFRVRGSLRCTRVSAWAIANGLDPWAFVGHDPFVGANFDPAVD